MTVVWLFLQLLYPLMKIRKTFRFDLIDTHFGHPEGVAGALLSSAFSVPFTMTLRGNEIRHGGHGLGRFMMRLALKRASTVFTVSERLRQFAISMGADATKVKTIPNGIDTRVFYPRDRAACRMKFGVAPDVPLIVSAGALVERKGHHRILHALAAMPAAGPLPHLLIAGGPGPEGQYEAKLRRLAADLGFTARVHFLGAVEAATMAEAMSAADVVCLASSNEGWPNVVHEALACGTPVVATDVGAIPEMLDGGRYGVIVPLDDQPALRHALGSAIERQWDRPAIAQWGGARSWSQVAAEVHGYMEKIVNVKEIRDSNS